MRADNAAKWKSESGGREQMHMVLPILRVHVWPTAGDFHQHGNQACECFTEPSEPYRKGEAAAGSAAAGHKLNFDR